MNNKKLPRVNREIYDRENPRLEVRVLDAEGEMIGVMLVYDALKIAESKGLDLIEISPNSTPPVCKLSDFGKLKYDMQKKQAEERKRNKVHDVKEVKFTINIATHDYQVKINHTKGFIEDGYSVKISCSIRGRDRAYGKDRLKPLFDRIIQEISLFGAVVSGNVEIKDNGGEFTAIPKQK
jgi:translation initiation factor IF-3